jgi:glycosyltransferase involved in cell wall biosynthesis
VTGTERYSVELLSAMADLDPPESIKVYLDTAAQPPGLRMPGTAVPLPARRFWTVRTLSAEMRRDPPDLLFVPSHVIPPLHPTSVVTIHDLGYLAEPDCHPALHRKQLEWATRWNVKAAAGIIAVSAATKRDLVDLLGVDPDRIEVIHHGVSRTLAPASENAVAAVRARYGIGSRTVLSVGTIQPRKNLVRLIQAFEQLAADDPEIQLLLCGAPGWSTEPILHRAAASPFHTRIRQIGYVPDSELSALFSSAAVLAFPSLYEGFGMPVLESMACGTPVVAANRSSLPEICGDAAVLIDPFDAASIAAGIHQAIHDDELRRDLVTRGFQQAQNFRWRNSAERTLAFLRSIGDN